MSAGAFKLTKRRRATLAAMAIVACPADLEQSDLGPAILDEVEAMLASFPPLTRRGLCLMLWAFEWLAMLRPSSLLRPFSRQPRPAQERWFASWWHNPLLLVRQFVKAVKGLLAMAYYEQPSVRARLGYFPEQWIEGAKKARIERHGDEIRREEERVTAPDPLPSRSRASSLVTIAKRPGHEQAT